MGAELSNANQNRAFRIAFKAARQGAGFTLQDLADELGAGGSEASLDTLTAWESGKDAPREWDRPDVEAVERTLGVDGQLSEALGWSAG
jgi:transcriptional regulator with XRE-family HTH domain